jgi:hypothetical protein
LDRTLLEDKETMLLQSVGKHKRNNSASQCRTKDSRSVEHLNTAWEEVKCPEVTGDIEIMAWL